jgi:hypothetical protein
VAPPPVDWIPVVFPLMTFRTPGAEPPITLPVTPAVSTIPVPFPDRAPFPRRPFR